MSANQSDGKSTRPAERWCFDKQIQASPRCVGSRWSVRKSQMDVQASERREGGSRSDRTGDEANSQHVWTKDDWQTKDGSADVCNGNIMKRTLPKEAWDLLTEEQKQATEQQQAPGERSVAETEAVKAARAYVRKGDPRSLNEEQLKRLTKTELVRIARKEDLPYRSKMNKAQLARTLRRHFRQPS